MTLFTVCISRTTSVHIRTTNVQKLILKWILFYYKDERVKEEMTQQCRYFQFSLQSIYTNEQLR
jgi:hypothetical protein